MTDKGEYHEPCARPGCRLVSGQHVWAERYTKRIGPRCSGFLSAGEEGAEGAGMDPEIVELLRAFADLADAANINDLCCTNQAVPARITVIYELAEKARRLLGEPHADSHEVASLSCRSPP